jgi:translocator protein
MNTTTLSRTQQAVGLIIWLALCFATSAIGAIASVSAKGFYAQVVRPSWAPPGWLFGPVWTTLFICMAVAAWLVWRAVPHHRLRTIALSVFVAQLAVNALWSWLFFAWRMGGAAFVDVMVLWLMIAATIALFWRISRVAAALLAPYLLWVSFAAVLNWTLWQTNPALLG